MSMDLNTSEIEMLNFFCFRLLPDYKSNKYNMPYLHFIFNEHDYGLIMNYLLDLKEAGKAIILRIKTHLSNRTVMLSEIDETIELIASEHEKYNKFNLRQKEEVNDEDIFITIPNYKEFFNLLDQLMTSFDANELDNNFNATGLLRSLWLRMSPTDIEDVIAFLKRQVAFTKNDVLLPTSDTKLDEINDLVISYLNHGNEDWFETNRHIKIFLKRQYGEIEDTILGGKLPLYKYYHLPVVHYGLIKEGDEPTCYIYGVQHIDKDKYENDPIINAKLQVEKKRLRNKEVSPDFVIALKIFLDILKSKGITTIKVPLLQVYNYYYHYNIGEKYRAKLESYSPEYVHNIECMNASDVAIANYENVKKQYERFYGKEEIISKGKTERLINAFYLLAEKYDDIKIINEPFIEGDNLICKIEYTKEKTL